MVKHLATTALAGAIALFAASACGGGGDVTMTLRADSSAEQIEVSYRVDDGERTVETVTPPWELTVEAGGRFSAGLTVTNPGESGFVACEIELAESSLSNPAARGEAEADCSMSGTARGSSLDVSSRSLGTPFEDPDDSADETPDDEDDAGSEDPDTEPIAPPPGVRVDVGFVDRLGDPVEPRQFDEVRVAVVVDGVDGTPERIQVTTDSSIDDGRTVTTSDERQLYGAEDVSDSGRLVHVLDVVIFLEPGSYATDVTGNVSIDGAEVPIDASLVADIAERDVTAEARSLSGGFVSLDVPEFWSTVVDVGVLRSVERSEAELSLNDVVDIAGVSFGGDDVAVFRFVGATGTTVEEVADLIEPTYATDASVRRTNSVVDGRPASRLSWERDGAGGGSADIVAVDGEILMVQARWTDVGTDVRRIRDSIRLDESVLPPLSRARPWVFTHPVVESEPATIEVVVAAPVDWTQVDEDSGPALGDSVDGSRVYVTFTDDPPDLDALLASELELWTGTVSEPVDVELAGSVFRRVDVDAATSDPVVVVATVIDSAGPPVGVTIATYVADPQAGEIIEAMLDELVVDVVTE